VRLARLGGEDLPLGDPAFRRTFAAEAISLLGSGVARVAIVFAALAVSDAAGVGVALAARQVPLVALLLGGGILADRRAPRTLMIAADAVRAASQATAAVLLVTGAARLWHLIALQVVFGTAEAFSLPAQMGLIADVVATTSLQAANSLRAFARSAADVAGPALAGVLVVAVGPGWGPAVDAASFAAAALLLSTVRVVPRPAAAASRVLADLRSGWRAFRASDWLWGGVATMSVCNGLFGVYAVLGPVVAAQDRGGAATWAAVVTAFGAGSVAGGIVLVRVRPRRPGVLLAASMVGAGGPALTLATGAPLPVILACSALAGAGLIGFNATWESTVQREVPRAMLSRVAAYDMFGAFALAPVGVALGGFLAAPLGAANALLVTGVLLLALPAVFWSIPGVRALRAPAAAREPVAEVRSS
jgi:predicted MFS family arabinose efflux permease